LLRLVFLAAEAEFSPSSTVVEVRPVCLAGQSALN
jgi:hypothetical protein